MRIADTAAASTFSKQIRWFAYLLNIAVLAVGLIVIVGWYTNVSTLVQIFPHTAPMQFNTAIGFLLLGSSSIALLKGKVNLARIFTIILFILGFLTLLQYLFNINIGIDELLMNHYITVETSHKGRMAPNTATCFILSASILFLYSLHSLSKHKNFYLSLATLIVFIFGGIAFVGYLLGSIPAYGWGVFTRMAIHTSLTFIAWSIATLLILSQNNEFNCQKTIIPLALFVGMSLLFISIWHFIIINERENINQSLVDISKRLAAYVQVTSVSQFRALERIAGRWSLRSGLSKEAFLFNTKSYGEDYRVFNSFVYIDAKKNIRWIQDLKNNEGFLTSLITNNSFIQSAFNNAKKTRNLIISPPSKLGLKKIGLWVILPLYSDKKFNGILVAPYEVNNLLKSFLVPTIKKRYNVAFYFKGIKIFSSTQSNNVILENISVHQNTKIANEKFTIKVWPTKENLNLYLHWMPNLILIIGFITAFIIAITTRFWSSLKESENNYNLLFLSAGEAIYGLDKNGLTTFVNPAAEKLLGYKAGELIGKPQHEIIHHSYIDGTPYPHKDCPIFSAIVEGKKHHSDNEVYWRKDGSYFYIEYISTPIRNSKGNIQGAVVTFKDITSRKLLEKKLRERKALLESANKELESFSYSVSHDLRAPLRHITGFIKLLYNNENIKLDDQAKKHFNIIDEAAIKMGTLIDDLLQFSRSGRFNLKKDKFSLKNLIKEVQTELSQDIANRNINISITGLPEIYADQNMMRLVMTNLISNAIKFTRHKEKAEIKIYSEKSNGVITIHCSDNGVGFNQKYADKIFDVFQRLHKQSEYEGTGIGLANVKRIISRHGGNVYAKSELDKGTTISFTLPKY